MSPAQGCPASVSCQAPLPLAPRYFFEVPTGPPVPAVHPQRRRSEQPGPSLCPPGPRVGTSVSQRSLRIWTAAPCPLVGTTAKASTRLGLQGHHHLVSVGFAEAPGSWAGSVPPAHLMPVACSAWAGATPTPDVTCNPLDVCSVDVVRLLETTMRMDLGRSVSSRK